jgi:uncharacterized protein
MLFIKHGCHKGADLWICAFFVFCFCSCSHLFFHPNRHLYLTPDRTLNVYDTFTIASSSGHLLHAWRIHSRGEKVGTLLHFYGNAQNKSAQFLFAQWFTEYGLDVVIVDYSGYGESQGQANRMNLHQDAVSILKSLSNESSLVVYCQSLGGAVCVPAIVEAKLTNINHVILESTFYNYRKMAQTKLSQFWLTWPLQWPLSLLVASGLDPIDYAPRLTVPVTMVHGDEDRAVPLSQGKRLYEAIGSSQKEFWQISGGKHTDTFVAENSPWREKIISRVWGDL